MTLLSTLFFLLLSVNMASCHLGHVNQNRELRERAHEQRRIGQTRVQDRQPRSVSTLNVLDFSADGDQQPDHWCLASNLRIGIYNGEMVLTDYSTTVGRILMIFFGRSPWNFNSDEMVKKSALQHVCAQNSHYVYTGFWPISAYFCSKVLRFFLSPIFPLSTSTWNFQGSISNARGTFEPKSHAMSCL